MLLQKIKLRQSTKILREKDITAKPFPHNGVELKANLHGHSQKAKEPLEKLALQIAKGAGITFFGDFFGKSVYFISQIVTARLLGIELFGLYVLGLVIFNVAQTLSVMGLSQGALRYVSIHHGAGDFKKVKGTIVQAIGFSFILGSIIGALLFAGSGMIASTFGQPELGNVVKVIAFGIPFMAAMMVSVAATRGFKKMQYFAYVKNIFHPIANLLLLVLLYLFGLGLLGAVSAWVIAAGFGLILAVYFIWKEFPAFTKTKASFETKELLKFSSPLLLVGFFQMLFFRTDILMLGYFRSSSEVGIYNAATQVMMPLIMFLMAFTSIFSPLAADLCNRKKLDDLNKLLKIVAKWTFLLTLPVFIILVFCPVEILTIFGPEYALGSTALSILTIFFFLSVAIGPITETLIMSGKQSIEFVNTLGAFILNLILNLFLIPKFGINGAALATGISVFTLHITRLLELLYFLRLWPLSRNYFKGIIAGFVVMGMTLFFKSLVPNVNSFQSLLTTTILVVISFIGLVLLLGLDEEDKLLLQAVRRRAEWLWS